MAVKNERKREQKMTYEELQKAYKNVSEELANARVKIENQEIEINNLRRIVFGTRREYTPEVEQEDTMQISLFKNEQEMDDNVEKEVGENVEEITVHKKKESKTKKAGIKKSKLKDTVIKKEEYKLNEEDKCEECGSDLELVGKKVVRQEIEYKPAELIIKEYVQYIYKCKECGTEGSKKDTPTFYKAEMPKPLLTHSFVSPSLATEILYQKYYLGVPLYRQEKMWDDKGLVLPRNMMANWCIKINEYYLNHIYELMQKELKKDCELMHVNETVMQCNKEPGRKATSNSYMWVMCPGELEKKKGVIFNYRASRSAETAKELLKGFKGILVTDGYSSYNNIEGVTHAECWAHARRYFYDSIPLTSDKKMDTSSDGYVGVTYCNELFDIEREIADLSVDEKSKQRQEKSKPVLEAFFAWINSMQEKIVLNKKLKEALNYTTNQKEELSQFLTDGRIPLTNSRAERAIRPFAVHRKNWLFADSVDGAKTNAVMYSIIETAKVNNLNIEKYIKYLLEKLPQLENLQDEETLRNYLPWSEELPTEILNYQGTYDELKLAE